MKAWHDCLYPVAQRASKSESHKRLPISFSPAMLLSLPAYLCLAEAIFRKSKAPIQKIDCIISQATCPDDLKGLNKSLLHAYHMEMLILSTQHINGWELEGKKLYYFNWFAGNGIAVLKDGLIRAPKLRILAFGFQPHHIDEKGALQIADIIISRQQMKSIESFDEVRFGTHSISKEAAWTLLEALKDYPVPIIIYVAQIGNFEDLLNPLGKDLRQFSKKVNLRWDRFDASEINMGDAYFFDESSGNSARQPIKMVEKYEAKRNK